MNRIPGKKTDKPATIKIVGVGGSGIRAISALFHNQKSWGELIAIDKARMSQLTNIPSIILGNRSIRHHASDCEQALIRQAAHDIRDTVKAALTDADMIFVLAGLGGVTGTEAVPVICQSARKADALVIAVVTTPFSFERRKRPWVDMCLAELDISADSVVVIPLDRLAKLYGKRLTPLNAFQAIGNPLGQVVKSIGEIIMAPGYQNVDFAEMKTLLSGQGRAFFGTATARGTERGIAAAQLALNHPLLPRGMISKARRAVINIAGGVGLTISEADAAVEDIRTRMKSDAHDAHIASGITVEPALEDLLRVSLVVTEVDGKNRKAKRGNYELHI